MLTKSQCPLYTINYSEDFDQVSEIPYEQIKNYIHQRFLENMTLEEADVDNYISWTKIKRYWVSESAADHCIAFTMQIAATYGYSFNITKHTNPEYIA